MKVVWKDIPNYEGIYQISNYGEILRLECYDSRGHWRNSRIKKQIKNKDGYFVVGLHKNGIESKFLVHRLVAQAFLNNPLNLPEVNHKDENKQNNVVSNLEWCTRVYNVNYGNAQTKRVKTWRNRREGEMILCTEKIY